MGLLSAVRSAFAVPDADLMASLANPPQYPVPQIASPWADSTALEVATWAGLLDQMENLPVTRSQAISLPAVARGRDLIVNTTAGLPLYAYNADGRLPAQPRICVQPEEGRARFITLTWTVDSLVFYGTAWWTVTSRYAEDGRPRTIRWVPQSQAEIDSNGNMTRAFGQDVVQADVIRIDGPHEGILARACETIRGGRKLLTQVLNASGNAVPDVELHQVAGDPLKPEEIDALVARWAAARAGRNGRVAYTNQSIQAIMHGQHPEQLLVAARDALALDLARHMNLSAWAVDAVVEGTSLTYANVPSRSRELIDYTLTPYMNAIAGRLSLDDILAAGTYCQFTTDALTDGDFGERMTAGKTAVDAGIYTGEQIADRERGIPLEGPTS